MLNEQGALWDYLSEPQQALIRQGYYLVEDAKSHTPVHPITDYSYLVFSFAKAYEGFLKQYFRDLGIIGRREYESDHFRIGKVLSPHLARMLKRASAYTQLRQLYGNTQLADQLWQTWKQGRNLIFHYFPHNLRAITLPEAELVIDNIVRTMTEAIHQKEHAQQKTNQQFVAIGRSRVENGKRTVLHSHYG